ncbi:uncharacterized protein LOC106425188 [Brassica napus]|uniref:uncharacterized protein LOC106425188 n=1 Tax=Brassica napus TaxID=3708 RepID=UPI0006AB1E52|nr:uncharacterized protein LOC106425188 [Brassica napus]
MGTLMEINERGHALLLPNGRTAHSRFNIPLKLFEGKLCNIKPGTMLAELIEKTYLIIWDETPMTHKNAFEALDKTLKDIVSRKNPNAMDQNFGGKTVLLDGDFRQILPVIPQGNRADTVREGHPQPESGNEYEDYHEQMIIVDKSLIRQSYVDPLKEVVNVVHGEVNKMMTSQSSYIDKAILTPRNETVDEINAYTISQTDGVSRDYFSSDSFEISETRSDQNDTLYAVEYLNSLEFSGLPSHKLTLKVGAPIMLLRNINQKRDYAMVPV